MRTLILITAVLASGCASSRAGGVELRPADAATGLPVPGPNAVATSADVALEVRAGIEHPREVDDRVTPLFVVVRNESGRDLLLRPSAFHLVTPTGERHEAIPPASLRPSDASPTTADVAMAIRGLQQDVLRAGGRAEGFLYFAELAYTGPLTLSFELRAEGQTAPFGLITMPLVATSGGSAGAGGPATN